MAEPEEDYAFECPYCMESNTVRVDLTGGTKQKFVHDCEVCCRPVLIKVEADADGIVNASAEKE